MEASSSSIIPYLFGITLLIGIAFGIYQYLASRRARRTHERSAAAEVRHEPYKDPRPAGAATSEAGRRTDGKSQR